MRNVIAGVIVALVVLLAGSIAVAQRDATFTAEARALIGPSATSSEPTLAVDTLSRGTVIATYAEIFASEAVIDAALASSGIGTEEQATITVRTRPLAGASAVVVEVVSDDRDLAERAATAVASVDPEIPGYDALFSATVLQGAEGGAVRNGLPDRALMLLLLGAALAVGVGTGAGLGRLEARRRTPTTTTRRA